MANLLEIIKRINGLVPRVAIGNDLPEQGGFAGQLPVVGNAPDIRRRPAVTGEMQYQDNLPVITQAPASAPAINVPPPTISNDDERLNLPRIVPVAPNEKEIAREQMPETGRPGALQELPLPKIPVPIPDFGEPPPARANELSFKPNDLPTETKERLSRPRVVPGEPINADSPQTRTGGSNDPHQAAVGELLGNVEQLIREREDYSRLKGKDLDANHDSKMTNFLKGLLNGVRVWSQTGGQGGIGGLLGAIGANGIANVASPHLDERIALQDKIAGYDRQIESGFNNLDKLTQLDQRRAATDLTRQRPAIEAEKEEGRNRRADQASEDKALSREQQKELFDKRLNAQKERWKQTDAQVRYMESSDGRGFLIDRYGKRTPAIDDATGKQFVNPYKQPFELKFDDGTTMTVPQSQAATIKGNLEARRYENEYRNAMEEYETKESNEALTAAVEAKKGEQKSYEGILESLRFVNSRLYDDFNESKRRLESLKDRPDDDTEKQEALSDFRRANNAVKQNEREITEFEEKTARTERDLTELNGKFKSAPPKKQIPPTKVYPRGNTNKGGGRYTPADIERIIRQ